ncbi:MAG: hypothetical protein KGH61_02015 [Candidatus Micrarchaeota archaeon]|nr:hypothetical protein [Candidatus Micrarchaeota archaeon]MDE1847706.1 hypothetical protein [Candidatus Micrarchaeota archaeon]MDE1864135.1 hypothetical protein [Candidatus Micrarchaeota archaeon]
MEKIILSREHVERVVKEKATDSALTYLRGVICKENTAATGLALSALNGKEAMIEEFRRLYNKKDDKLNGDSNRVRLVKLRYDLVELLLPEFMARERSAWDKSCPENGKGERVI